VQDEIENLLAQTEALRARLIDLVEEDIAAYYKLSSAYKMPRDTDEEKVTRSAAIQAALHDATQPPMAIAEACVEVLRLSKPMAEIGNVNAVSDAGVAALLAEAALRSAALNILINLGAIKDEEFVNWGSKNLKRLLDGTAALKEEIYELVVSKL
jgi:formiminotetrahydrofolate cyclodeaminase